MLESFKSLARGTHLNPSWDPAIPVAIPQRAKQGDNRSGYRLVKSEALGPCTGGQQQQSPRAAGRTRPCSGSPPRRAPSSGSRGRSATCPKNTAKNSPSATHTGQGTALSQQSPAKSTAAGTVIDQWLKHPFGLAAAQKYKLDLGQVTSKCRIY